MATSARDQFEKQLHESLESLKEQREKLTHNQKEINELKQQAIAQKCDLLYGKGIHTYIHTPCSVIMWSNSYQCMMRILRPGLNSQRVPHHGY